MAEYVNKKQSESGICLGGIGTGSVELLPDGQFHYWQIYNTERWAHGGGDRKVDDGEQYVNALEFYVRAKKPGKPPIVRKLGQRTSFEDFTYSMFAWNKPIPEIAFSGKFPFCELNYRDKTLPCRVKCTAVAPFVPHHLKSSATPGFYLDFEINNPTDSPLEVSLAGVLAPAFIAGGVTENRYIKEKDKAYIFLNGVGEKSHPATGNMAFSISGDGEKSHITADFDRFLKEYVAYCECFGVSQESFLFSFREKGVLPNTEIGVKPVLSQNPDKADEKSLLECYEQFRHYPSVQSYLRRIRETRPGYPASREDYMMFMKDMLIQQTDMGNGFGSAALCSRVILKPNETKMVKFVLSWYFPNHYSTFKKDADAPYGDYLGHYYETLYANALEANRYLTNNEDTVKNRALAFANLLYNTSLPVCYSDAWSGQLSTIVKDSWLIKDGKFGLWEGLGYCGLHTTDITYHASFGIAALFPELQLTQMRMGASLQREDGRVHHSFSLDLSHVDNGFDRVDMNPQFVLMVLRDYLFTGNVEYLKEMYPHVLSAMEATARLDTDDDGLPDKDTKRNTYDSWDFRGISAYISVLWLSALRASWMLAGFMHDKSNQKKWKKLLDKGLKSLEDCLFNGSYYNLWCDQKECDGSLMTDQLDGEWFLRMVLTEGNLKDTRVRSICKTVFEQNFDSEDGLLNATCPPNHPFSTATYRNCQAGAVWTGIGYAFSALALSVGLQQIADTQIKAIHRAQESFGRLYNHWECGYRYTRPLSSFTTLMAVTGAKINAPERILQLKPVYKILTAPVITPFFTASVSFYHKKCSLTVIEGDISGWEICLPAGMELEIN